MSTPSLHVPPPEVCPLRFRARRSPDAPLFEKGGEVLTYAEVDARVEAVRTQLAAAGIRAGERVGVYIRDAHAMLEVLQALLRMQAVACLFSTRYPLDGIRDLMTRTGAARCVVEDPLEGAPWIPLPRLRSPLPPPAKDATALSPSQPATVVFTTGSTGGPRAALHSYGNHYYSALGAGRYLPYAPGDRWWLTLPVFHVGGLAIWFRTVLAGATLVLPGPEPPPGVTHVSMVATQLYRILREGRAPAYRGLKTILLGGGAVPEALLSAAREARLPVHTTYGLTEMASQVATSPSILTVSSGEPGASVLPYRELTVDAQGEILVRGETLFLGYVDGEAVHRPLDEAGWFHTRDRGYLEAGGLHVQGRLDNVFISGGENIQPEVIERCLLAERGVEQALVVPVPDEEFGARPCAFIDGPAADDPDRLVRAITRSLPRFMVPVAFLPWPSDPPMKGIKLNRSGFAERARRALRFPR